MNPMRQSTNVGSAIGARGRPAAATAQCLSTALFLLAALPVCAQRLPTRHYDVSDGLANSHVKAIRQDRKGYIWFGTQEGLSRFDGYRFTNYGERDGLGHVIVNDIVEDRQGRLWVGTNGGGVARLIDDPREPLPPHQSASSPGERRKFVNFRVGDSAQSNQVNALLFDAHDNLWVATDAGLYRAAAGQGYDLKFELVAPHSDVGIDMAAFADRHGRLWFGVAYDLVEVVQGRIIKYGPDDGVGRHGLVSVVEDRHGRLLVANEHEVFEFIAPPDGQSRGQWRPFPLALAPDQRVAAMKVDAGGALWVGTWNGLIKYRNGKQTLFTTTQGLSSNVILALTEDRDGNLWIGTRGGGVCKFYGELIVSFTRTEGLPDQGVYRVTEDRRLINLSGTQAIVNPRKFRFPAAEEEIKLHPAYLLFPFTVDNRKTKICSTFSLEELSKWPGTKKSPPEFYKSTSLLLRPLSSYFPGLVFGPDNIVDNDGGAPQPYHHNPPHFEQNLATSARSPPYRLQILSVAKGPKMIDGSDIKFISGNCRGRSDAFAQIVARQHFQTVAGAEDDDRAGFTGCIDSSVRRNRRGDVLAERSKPLPIQDDLACHRLVARHHAAIADDIEPSLVEERRRHFRNSPAGGPRHVALGAVAFTARAHRDDHVRVFFHKEQHAFPLSLRKGFVLVKIYACYHSAYWQKVSRSLFRDILAQMDSHVCGDFILG